MIAVRLTALDVAVGAGQHLFSPAVYLAASAAVTRT